MLTEDHATMKMPLIIVALLMLAACSTKPYAVKPPKGGSGTKQHPLYVVNHGWHTGFIVPAVDLFDRLPWLEKRFASTPYLEFGWGDRDFYQAEKMTTGLTLKAAVWPTDTVMRVAAMPQAPQRYDAGHETRLICLTDLTYPSFIDFLLRSFYRDTADNIVDLGHGLYGNSQFYQAVGQYSLFNTCNTWTAKGLQSAGIAIAPTFKFTASSIMHAIKAGRTCQARPRKGSSGTQMDDVQLPPINKQRRLMGSITNGTGAAGS